MSALNSTDIDALLGTLDLDLSPSTSSGSFLDTLEISPVEYFYPEGTDPRLLNLSYSGLLSLHSCPRMFQLDKLNATAEQEESIESSITFAFGHVVGLGIQMHFEGYSEDQIIWQLFLFWKPDLFAANDKQKKSFWLAIGAVQSIINMRAFGFLSDYELVYHNGKPATELSFCITLPDGYRYRGFVDAVLRHKVTGKIIVLECKTTSATNLNPATYKNSAQAVGYSVVLDDLFPDLSAYEVMYLVYCTKNLSYEVLPFPKSFLQRALWIQELLLDVEVLKLYESRGVYPMHGENCIQWGRDCKYLQNCTLDTAALSTPETLEDARRREEKEADYQVQVNIQDLIARQLSREEIL